MAPKHSHIAWRLFYLPDSLWAQSVVFFGLEDKDEDLTFAQESSAPGQFAQQGKLRITA